MSCEDCKDTAPCCDTSKCVAGKSTDSISMCICCGAEMRMVNGLWYHWSQFDDNGKLLTPEYSHYSE